MPYPEILKPAESYQYPAGSEVPFELVDPDRLDIYPPQGSRPDDPNDPTVLPSREVIFNQLRRKQYIPTPKSGLGSVKITSIVVNGTSAAITVRLTSIPETMGSTINSVGCRISLDPSFKQNMGWQQTMHPEQADYVIDFNDILPNLTFYAIPYINRDNVRYFGTPVKFVGSTCDATDTPYVRFTGDVTKFTTLSLAYHDGTAERALEITQDGWWVTWDGSTHTVQNGECLVRGINNNVVAGFSGGYSKVSGNAYALLNRTNPVLGANQKFNYYDSAAQIAYGLFGCSHSVSAPFLTDASEVGLKSLTLGTSSCYASMFRLCTALTLSPELPATTLSENCYSAFFLGCSSLTIAPKLPAMTCASNCYNSMFTNCSSLVTPPELSATTLATSCYYSMFQACTSLISTPALSATTLAQGCYKVMFNGCTKLVTACALPATESTNECYRGMFRACTSLVTPPTIALTTTSQYCCYEMFYGCTSLVITPVLHSTVIAESAYRYMFNACASLATVTALPGVTLGGNCYGTMFSGCSKLSGTVIISATSPYSAGTTSACSDMFKNAGTTAPSTNKIKVGGNLADWNAANCGIDTTKWTVELIQS